MLVQSASLTDNQVLATDLPGQSLTVYLKPSGVVISGVQTAANVTQANIVASKVTPHLPYVSRRFIDLPDLRNIQCKLPEPGISMFLSQRMYKFSAACSHPTLS